MRIAVSNSARSAVPCPGFFFLRRSFSITETEIKPALLIQEQAGALHNRVTKLLKLVGQTHSPDCQCKSEARKMDLGNMNIRRTLRVMRREAKKRTLIFIESQARWLIELAIKIAEENHEPNKIEKIRLRAMRLGNQLVNGA